MPTLLSRWVPVRSEVTASGSWDELSLLTLSGCWIAQRKGVAEQVRVALPVEESGEHPGQPVASVDDYKRSPPVPWLCQFMSTPPVIWAYPVVGVSFGSHAALSVSPIRCSDGSHVRPDDAILGFSNGQTET